MRNDLNGVIQHLTSRGYSIHHVFDIGANKGEWTTQHLQWGIPDATFFMFEANPKHHRPVNLPKKHKWFNAALSNSSGIVKEFSAIGGTGDSFYTEQTSAYRNCDPIELTTITLDEIIKSNELPTPQLMKLDTQGSELDILRGAKTLMGEVDIIVTEMSTLPPPFSYNAGAPTFDEYMEFFVDFDYVPVGVETVHTPDNRLVQLDVVFLNQSIKAKYYGDNFFRRKT